MATPVRPDVTAGIATLTPKEILGILRRHILLMVSMTILGVMVGGTAWFLLLRYAPKYTAQTFIRVLPPVEKDPLTIPAAQADKQTRYGYRLTMVTLIKQQSSLQKLLGRDKIQNTAWFEGFGDIKEERIHRAFKSLEKYLTAYAQRDGEFITLSMTCGDKKEAALIVNEMVDLFLASQGSTKRAEVAAKLARLSEQLDSVQRDLDSAERALDIVRSTSGFSDLEERQWQHTVTMRLNDLEIEQNNLTLEIGQIQATIETLKRQAIGPVGDQVSRQIEADPVMTMLAQQLALQEAELKARLTKFGGNHRAVREMQERTKATKEEREVRRSTIAEQVRRSNLANAEDQLIVWTSKAEQLKDMRDEAAKKQEDLNNARVQYEQRMAIRDERKQRLEETKAQIEKLRIVREDPETPKVQFVGYAPEPMEISSPKRHVYFPTGAILGLMCGMGLAFLIELLNDLVRTPRDVDRYLRIPLLGTIPNAEEDGELEKVDLCHIVHQAPYSVISESYRRFRTNLKLSDSAANSSVLLISSGMPADGRTSVAANLALSFVAENRKVLLVDANFWRPSLHNIFPGPKVSDESDGQAHFGLSNLLMGQCGYQEVVRSSGFDRFDIIDSGSLPSNPTELLGGEQMARLIEQQRESYDYVIIDSPPILLVSDTKMLARLVDGTILVFNAGATKRGAARRTIRELRQVNAPIAGCVLFAVRAMKGGYFQEQFKSYQEYQKLQIANASN